MDTVYSPVTGGILIEEIKDTRRMRYCMFLSLGLWVLDVEIQIKEP